MVRTVSESCWRVLVAYESTTEESESRCKQGTSDETALGLTVGGGGPIVWRRDKVDSEQSGPEPSENEEGVFVGGGVAVRSDFSDLVCAESRLFRWRAQYPQKELLREENPYEEIWSHAVTCLYFRRGGTNCLVRETLPRRNRTLCVRGYEHKLAVLAGRPPGVFCHPPHHRRKEGTGGAPAL